MCEHFTSGDHTFITLEKIHRWRDVCMNQTGGKDIEVEVRGGSESSRSRQKDSR